MAKKPKASTLKNKCDVLFSKIVRSRGVCQWEDDNGPCSTNWTRLETSHVFGRRASWIRCDERNAFALCSTHHRLVSAFPYDHIEFARRMWAAEFGDWVGTEREMMGLRNAGKLPYNWWATEWERLRARAAELGIDL